ncbi:hypothetical protein E4U53_006466 [Claviceps sorghi]|nr:hypothetical protein E4U53_006466 [Claviceps sorghi]
MAGKLPRTSARQTEPPQPPAHPTVRTAYRDFERSIKHNYGEMFGHKNELLIVTKKRGRGRGKEGTWTAQVSEIKTRPRHTRLHAEGKSESNAIRNLHLKSVRMLEERREDRREDRALRSSLPPRPRPQSGRQRGQRQEGENLNELLEEGGDKDDDENDGGDEDTGEDCDQEEEEDGGEDGDQDDDQDDDKDDDDNDQADRCQYLPNLNRPPPPTIPVEHPLPISNAAYMTGRAPISTQMPQRFTIDVRFLIRSSIYGILDALVKTEFDHYHLDKTVRYILRTLFKGFSSRPSTPLSHEEVACLPLRFVSVTVDGRTTQLGGGVWNWSTLGVVSATQSVVVDAWLL